ncbi:DUF5695 domain-containing protein [Bifidobacterium myosotis]|uniref:Uncharacterized protein n=1 Tax=Bifidobacterium myosotis TaxID=1630166 RepID=A0A5M9ZIA5_9BIFI|nr:DUF5695 domain-containing protein [Bifidobacterium myosotis]KAA8827093.1 hypothetical protein EMO91_09970 [Bifidobacterium myosotis]
MQIINDDDRFMLTDPHGTACPLAPITVGAVCVTASGSRVTTGALTGQPDAHGIGVTVAIDGTTDDVYASLTVTVRNDGDAPVTLDDLYADFGVARTASNANLPAGLVSRSLDAGVSASGTHTAYDPSSITHPDDRPTPLESPDAFLLLPYAGQRDFRLLVMPYDTTQFELVEPNGPSDYRCYLRSAGRRGAPEYSNTHWHEPARTLTLAPGRAESFTILLTFASSENDIASFLVRFAQTPRGFADGVNGMDSLYHFLLDDPKSIHASHDLTNGYQSAVITDGRLSSLTTPAGGIEAIDPDMGFGDVTITYDNDRKFSTAGLNGHLDADGDAVFRDGPLEATLSFRLDGRTLHATVSLANTGSEPLTLTDVSMAVPLNSRMAWGVDAAQRMIRHTQVAGDNSFMLATPSDGKPPYLLGIPADGVRWELFDLGKQPTRDGETREVYRIHMHGDAAAAEARTHEGGRWRLPTSSLTLAPGERRAFGLDLLWVDGYDEARRELIAHGKLDVQVVPGYTLPRGTEALIKIDSRYADVTLTAEHPDETAIRLVEDCVIDAGSGDGATGSYAGTGDGNGMGDDGNRHGRHGVFRRIYGVRLDRLGENLLTLRYGDGHVGYLELFATLPVGELIDSRADYLRRCQADAPDKWYDGLLQERNTKTGALLNPDNYDEIKGWRIYEVTCDDPGLAKPAFLAAKNAEHPVEDEVRALDRYLGSFVWGGLQRTDEEEWPYGVYGVPDWKNLRDHRGLNGNEQLHIGRLWDYPHVALTWFMMYRIAVRKPEWTALPAREYLKRAWGTFTAMYRYPDEVGYDYESKLDNTSPYRTGYYNELVIADVIDALRVEGEPVRAAQLEAYWNHKADFLIRQAKDLFGSEYAFDTTGFETTQAVVDWGRGHAMRVWNTDGRSATSYRAGDVERFDRYQRACNIACRGWLENGYYVTGSDIRNDTMQYTLSYMSQMGGWSLLQDALYADGSPFGLLRLASASLLSSWALVNAGDKESGYGYWFPGAENQGASSGGFEPLPYATTWLGQPADRGYWIYGCETDLGYCGYLRGAATVVADDPDFGRVVYGGTQSDDNQADINVTRDGDGTRITGTDATGIPTTASSGLMMRDGDGTRITHITPTDGVNRRFHLIRSAADRIHVMLDGARYASATIEECESGRTIITLDVTDVLDGRATLRAFAHDGTVLTIGRRCGRDLTIPVSDGPVAISLG